MNNAGKCLVVRQKLPEKYLDLVGKLVCCRKTVSFSNNFHCTVFEIVVLQCTDRLFLDVWCMNQMTG